MKVHMMGCAKRRNQVTASGKRHLMVSVSARRGLPPLQADQIFNCVVRRSFMGPAWGLSLSDPVESHSGRDSWATDNYPAAAPVFTLTSAHPKSRHINGRPRRVG